jgi:hypothetical protein
MEQQDRVIKIIDCEQFKNEQTDHTLFITTPIYYENATVKYQDDSD